ncbi:MAG: YdcF family protein [Alicyclobacillus sp.]|nr:YdcF family protein [Alicyclobacillus sp.]
MLRVLGFALVGAVAAAVAFVVGLQAVGRQIRRVGRRQRPVPSDVAIVLGAYTHGYRPSPVLADRLRAALQLYRQGYVRYFIVSGGRGADETVSESSSMKRFLVLNGVPPEDILQEMTSADTWENLRNSRQVMLAHGLRTAVVVTSDYHLPRALAVAQQLHIDATGFAAWSTSRDWRATAREVLASMKYTVSGQATWRRRRA